MTITLSTETWENLAHEFCTGHWSSDRRALDNALTLRDFLLEECVTEADGTIRCTHEGITWQAQVCDPYFDLESLCEDVKAFFKHGVPVKVTQSFYPHPVFKLHDQVRYQVWHDTAHYRYHQGFDRAGELDLFVAHAGELRRTHGSDATPLIEALFSESVYRLAVPIASHGDWADPQPVRTPGPAARALFDAWGL